MQFIRIVLISILAGLIAAGLVWLLGDLIQKITTPTPALLDTDSGDDDDE